MVIYDVYQEKTMDRFQLKYVGLKCGNAFQFIHEDTKLLIAAWEGVYVKELNLPGCPADFNFRSERIAKSIPYRNN